jgi:hypothetical protein
MPVMGARLLVFSILKPFNLKALEKAKKFRRRTIVMRVGFVAGVVVECGN